MGEVGVVRDNAAWLFRRSVSFSMTSKAPARSLRWIVEHAPSFVRRDPGGKVASSRKKAMREAGIPVTPDTEAAFDGREARQ